MVREELLLGNAIAKGFATVEHLIEDDTRGPDVHLAGDLGVFFTGLEALRRLIPIGSCALGSQLCAIRVLFVKLRKTKIGDLDLSVMKQNVAFGIRND